MMKRLVSNLWAIFLFFSIGLSAQTTVSGTIMDEELNEPLIGANVIIVGTTIGTSTDLDGNFSITSSQPLPWALEVSYTGYSSKTMQVTGPTSNLRIALAPGAIIGQEVVISASRRREKVQEAPASISVLSSRKLETSANATDATRNLVNLPGVQVQQQSANRINISMRGGAGLFGTSVFPIMDYRSLVGPGIGTFQTDNSGINQLDLQRVEVVRGPGSALYGPGVTQGVVHFITKNPIDFPGTSIELVGGELNTFGGTLRHATKVSDKFGFKINAFYRRGDEFTLDPNDPSDAIQIGRFATQIVQPAVSNGIVDVTGTPEVLLTMDELDDDRDGNVMQNDWFNFSANTTLEFRPQDNLSFFLSGGYNQASSVFYNEQGEGLAQASEYWTQARMQLGGLFAQVFYVDNNGGDKDKPSFLYQTGNRTPVGRTQLEAQLQYNFDTPSFLDANWTAGFDYRFAGQETENLVYGRNEEDDDFAVYGGYLQGKFALSEKLDLVAAGRYDRFNFIDDGAFAPRAALVYKVTPKHTLRASYNRSNTTVSNLQLNIDFPLSVVIPGSFDVWLYGNKTTQTFNNPELQWFTGLIPSIPVSEDGVPLLNGLPLGVGYGLVAADVIAGLSAGLSQDPQLAPLLPAIIAGLGAIDPATLGTTGTLSPGFNIFDRSPLGLTDAPISVIETHDNYEVGYKGLIGNKLGALLDVYFVRQKNNSQFTAISPAYVYSGLENLPADLGNAVGAAAQGPIVQSLMANAGLDQATAEFIYAGLAPFIVGGFTQGGAAAINTPSEAFGGATLAQVFDALPFHATVPTNQVPQNGITHLAAGYRTFDEREFWGIDLGLEYYFTGALTSYFNYSWVNKTQFMQNVVGIEGDPLPSSLNIPKNKFRLGVNYAPEFGWRGSIAFQHDDSYAARAGQFSTFDANGVNFGTEERNLVDAAVGYKFDSGLAIDVSASNLLDNEYRYLPNMPKIGRRVLGKLTYDFGGKQDADGDGVADSKDDCPNTPGLKAFGGCPDSDGDGLMDSADSCPLAAGSREMMGCPDGDGDGVADKDDNCPTEAGPLNGCPDTDGDGIADGVDNCPTEAGTLNGCPDGDGDGVADGSDECPGVAGPVNGCPDGDGDGVADKNDACPTVAGTTANGCPADPDSDGDGLADSKDACPNAAGPVNGCPDGDNDGIADKDDKCPTLGGNVTSDGCPVVPERVTEVFTRALQGIQFETGSNRIRSASRSILAEVVSIMNNNPTYNLVIAGHTDSIGSSDSNQRLSQRRADAVRQYLIDRGVAASRLTAVGYGESQPIADNKYAAGRKQNRRVELSVNYRQ